MIRSLLDQLIKAFHTLSGYTTIAHCDGASRKRTARRTPIWSKCSNGSIA